MPLDPNNPVTPTDTSLETWRTKDIEFKQRQTVALESYAAATGGTPTTEGGIFLHILAAVLMGKLAGSSADAQIWATDLTRDYLLKYQLNGTPRS